MSDTTVISVNFGFRKNKDSNWKRPNVQLDVPAPSKDGIIAALNGDDPNVRDLVLDAVHGVVTSHLRSFVDNDLDFTQETCDALAEEGKLSLKHIANIPKADRNTMSKEELEAFASDYIETMPGITGKDVARVKAAAQLIVERFKRAAGDESVLAILQDQLVTFAENAPDDVVTRNEKALTWALNKVESLMQVQVSADAL
ncbi:hypothetical protein [Candidatus Macondimonas diazotrophica]|jgi:hypothetical protein|uniref:Uncharacterized protein n=1 Tax=Candidatus Macondimonas diazotrophica TaxID=2305248 RepID=A0A4Z0F6U1_9GAMM|nr:hypothetical protein [Candidatus Macondimonas diazotrophica]TFZ81676.1 hypothetical protein E4680_11440 [Candidatus Macondimonas diazotrophica]